MSLTLSDAPERDTATATELKTPVKVGRQEDTQPPVDPTKMKVRSAKDFGIVEPTLKAETLQTYPPQKPDPKKIENKAPSNAKVVLESSTEGAASGARGTPVDARTTAAIDKAMALYFASTAENFGSKPQFVQRDGFWEFSYYVDSAERRYLTHRRVLHAETVCVPQTPEGLRCELVVESRKLIPPSGTEANRRFSASSSSYLFQGDPDIGFLIVEACPQPDSCYKPKEPSSAFRDEVLADLAEPVNAARAPLPEVEHLNYQAFEIEQGVGEFANQKVLRVLSADVGFGYALQDLKPGQAFVRTNGDVAGFMITRDPHTMLRILAMMPEGKGTWFKLESGDSLDLRRSSSEEYRQLLDWGYLPANRWQAAAAPLLDRLREAEVERQKTISALGRTSVDAANGRLLRVAEPIARQLMAIGDENVPSSTYEGFDVATCQLINVGRNPEIFCWSDRPDAPTEDGQLPYNPRIALYPATATYKMSGGAKRKNHSVNLVEIAKGCESMVTVRSNSALTNLYTKSVPVDRCKKIIYIRGSRAEWTLSLIDEFAYAGYRWISY